MKRSTTWGLVGALALVATLGVTFQPSGKRGEENSRADYRAPRKLQPKAGESSARLACDDLADALELFLDVRRVQRPAACFDTPSDYAHQGAKEMIAGAPQPLRFVIATLPDPVHTHLPLLFDRMVESIQESAQDEKLSYEASWLPWEDKEQTYQFLADDDRSEDRKEFREKQPGILLFRNSDAGSAKGSDTALLPYREGLLVFVVGEDPTRGIHTDQFENALDWIKELKDMDGQKDAHVAILGPTFSGSFASLQKLLSNGDSAKSLTAVHTDSLSPLAIYTGTANSADAVKNFKNSNPALDFHSFLEKDEVGLDRFCSYIKSQLNRSDSIAVLSEDETLFGHESVTPTQSPKPEFCCLSHALWVYYPRDISSLRAAYQDSSVFKNAAPEPAPNADLGRLPSDLADPEGQDHDTVRSYAGNQTPLSQEAYLLGIVNVMRVHHVQYVILRSTNALDQLFLTRYLRRAYPDARIVTDSADRLFEREPSTAGMGDTMNVGTYPLLEREQEWIAPAPMQGGQRSFNSEFSEGTYIAFSFLLHARSLSDPASSDPCSLKPSDDATLPALPEGCPLEIPDYGLPSWMKGIDPSKRPATWISVLGRDGYWAIAAINKKTLQHEVGKGAAPANDPPLDIPLSLKIWMVCLAGFCAFHLWCCAKASFTAKPAFRSHFANPRKSDHTTLIFLGSCFVATLPLIVAWGCGVFDSSSAKLPAPWWVTPVLSFECLLAFAASLVNVSRLEQLKNGSNNIWTGMSSVPGILFALLAAGSALWMALFIFGFAFPLQCRLEPANRFFTYYRSIHLLSGVSPLVPFLAMAFGWYLWFWHSLHGLALFGSDQCVLPNERDLVLENLQNPNSPLHVLPMFSNDNAGANTERDAKPLNSRAWKTTVVLFAGLLLVVLLVSRHWPVRSLGAKYYAIVFLLCLLVSFSLMLTEAWQLLTTWSNLRELLVFLDRLALRRTLAALRGFSWGSVWGMSGNVLDVRYKLLSRQLESLHHTQAALNQWMNEKKRNFAACRSQAAGCIALLTKLRQQEKPDERLSLMQECLDALKTLSDSAPAELRPKIDEARNLLIPAAKSAPDFSPRDLEACRSVLADIIGTKEEDVVGKEQQWITEVEGTQKKGLEFAEWYAPIYNDPNASGFKKLEDFQSSAAKTAAFLLTRMLVPEWHTEKLSLVLQESQPDSNSEKSEPMHTPLSKKQYIRDAEEFVCLLYLGFVQNILGRMRSMVMSILWLFVAAAVAISSYPFDPRQGLSGSMLALFLVLVGVIFYVYAQMHRDATLSHVTNTTPGELGAEFWIKIIGFGIAPLLSLLTTIFPGIADSLFSWLQPGLQSLK